MGLCRGAPRAPARWRLIGCNGARARGVPSACEQYLMSDRSQAEGLKRFQEASRGVLLHVRPRWQRLTVATLISACWECDRIGFKL